MAEDIYNLEIFKGIEHDVVDHIITHCKVRSYSAGEVIVMEGETSNGEGYIIKSGKVIVSINGNDIKELGEGDIFGEIALLNEEERTATIKAITNLEVIVLSYDDLIEMINSDENKINKTIMERIEENISMI